MWSLANSFNRLALFLSQRVDEINAQNEERIKREKEAAAAKAKAKEKLFEEDKENPVLAEQKNKDSSYKESHPEEEEKILGDIDKEEPKDHNAIQNIGKYIAIKPL